MSNALTGEPTGVSGSSLGPADDRPLTDQEFQLLQRLLSDPFSFPAPYKSWLVSYLETSDMNLPISAINGLAGILGITGIGSGTLGIFPAGVILPFGGPSAPTGALLCDGSSYDTTLQNRLFTAIGYRYGGSAANFNVPDLRGRTPVGLGTHADVNALGANDGLPANQRTPKHGTSLSDPGHGHTINDPQHGHSASGGDNGHNHSYSGPNISGAGAGSSGAVGEITASSQTTGIGIASIYVNVAAASTGISVNGNGSGISVGLGSGRPQDTGAFEVCNFIIVN